MSRQTWSTNSSEDVAVDSWRSSKQLGEGHSGATGGSDSDAEQQDHQPQQLAPVVHDSSHGLYCVNQNCFKTCFEPFFIGLEPPRESV